MQEGESGTTGLPPPSASRSSSASSGGCSTADITKTTGTLADRGRAAAAPRCRM